MADPEALRVRRYELGSQRYQELLREYLRGRLKLDLAKPENAELAEVIIRAADNRFAYVSFLADRYESAQLKLVAGESVGADFYGLWLQSLEREYGRKQADAIRQVLALLAADEEAHGWVFGEGRKIDPATGGALTPLPEQFPGLEIGLLANLLDRDRPGATTYDRIDPGLLFTLQMLQGVVWASRAGEGATQFRLALKEFLPAAQADAALGPLLPLMHARIASKALDAAEQIGKDGWDQAGEAGVRFLALAPLLEAAVHLSRSQPIAQRRRPEELIALLASHDNDLQAKGHALTRVPWLTLIAAWRLPQSVDQLTVDQRNYLAGSLENRGNAKQFGVDLAGAIADYDAAIALRQAIRAAMGNAWPVPLQNALTMSLQNRGAAKAHGGDLASAIADYDAAIALMQATRAAMGNAWPMPLQNDLAAVLQNRGVAKANGGDLAGAIADYDAAIALMQATRTAMGNAWPVLLQDELAGSLQNRGLAKNHGGNLAGAIADSDAAIALRQAIRAAMGNSWPVPLQNYLAMSLENRGTTKWRVGDLAGAIADYDAAIALRQAIRAAMGDAWPVPLQNNLAGSLQNRGLAKADSGELPGAIADYDAALALMQAIRAAMGNAWPVPLQNDLAKSLQNRGNAKQLGGDLADAIADYDAAIALRQTIRAAMGNAWPVPLQNDLAVSLYNRARAKRVLRDTAGARVDISAGLEIQERIVGALGSQCPPSYRQLLDALRRLQRELSTQST